MTENELNQMSLPAEEARLVEDLRRLAIELQPDAGFQAGLEKKLMHTIKPEAGKPAPHKTKNHWIPVIGWLALAAVLIVGLSLVLSTFLPRGIQPAASPEVPVATQPAVVSTTDTPVTAPTTATEAAVNPTQPPLQPVEQPSPTPPGPTYVLSIQSDYDFHLGVDFPASPSDVGIYRQLAPEALTIDNAREVAKKLGINGGVYVAPYGAPDQTSYRVQEGERYVIFFDSPQFYTYDAHSSVSNQSFDCQPPCISPEGNGALLKFINQRGLIDFPATSQLSPNRPQVEQLVQLIDGLPLGYSPGTPEGDATISSSGEVLSLNLNPVKYEPVSRLPILTAQQAWDQAIDSHLINGMDMSEMSVSNPDLLSWYRQHPLDQRVELFGWISSFKSAEQGKPPLILLDGYPVTGSTQGMESVEPSNAFAQVWGTFRADGQGGRGLEVEGWQLSPFPSESITGTVMLRGDASYVLTNGRLLRLPDAPTDLPLDTPLFFNGVVLESPEPTIEWSSISNSIGGGGGGGGSLWPEVYLEGANNPQPTAEPTPVPPDLTGQRLEGVQGKPLVFIHQYTDGSTTVEVMFYLNPDQGLPSEDTYYLEGPGIAGIEAYHQLPVKVWGSISESKNHTYKVNVEKLEPVYPGVKVQVWLGKFEKVSLEGKDVALFTSSDGSQFVLSSSLSTTGVDYGIVPGDPAVVEGMLIPDQSFGGHPVVVDFNVNPASGMDDLQHYAAMTLEPIVIKEPGKAGTRRIGTVTKIELAYFTDEPRNTFQPPGALLPFVQPVWRFSGTYDDGATFELIVQALDPTYLKMP